MRARVVVGWVFMAACASEVQFHPVASLPSGQVVVSPEGDEVYAGMNRQVCAFDSSGEQTLSEVTVAPGVVVTDACTSGVLTLVDGELSVVQGRELQGVVLSGAWDAVCRGSEGWVAAVEGCRVVDERGGSWHLPTCDGELAREGDQVLWWDGQQAWPLDEHGFNQPFAVDGLAEHHSSGLSLRWVGAQLEAWRSGQQVWRAELPLAVTGVAAVDRWVAARVADGRLVVLDPADGRALGVSPQRVPEGRLLGTVAGEHFWVVGPHQATAYRATFGSLAVR